MTDKWLELNKESWDERAPINVRSEFYDNDAFKAGRSSLVNDELDTIGDVSGKTLLHLQCHFGQDTLSWARAGASVTGLDFSQKAITAARSLALELDINAQFVVSNVYDAPATLSRQYDVVYTGIGSLCWLPDITSWAQVVAALLQSGGELSTPLNGSGVIG